MRVYVSVDDTDSKESRGTGFRCRQMGSELMLAGHGKVLGVTRHQLYLHDLISYTWQNSANCLEIETNSLDKLWEFCRKFLLREVHQEGDVGLCMSEIHLITPEIEAWGRRAKTELLTQADAKLLAVKYLIRLEGLAGTNDGIIGALAAMGLRASGNDGRFIWQPGKQLRDMLGTVTVEELLRGTIVDGVLTKDGVFLQPEEKIDLGDWVRAILINKKAVIIAERNMKKSGSKWKTADKAYVKQLSS